MTEEQATESHWVNELRSGAVPEPWFVGCNVNFERVLDEAVPFRFAESVLVLFWDVPGNYQVPPVRFAMVSGYRLEIQRSDDWEGAVAALEAESADVVDAVLAGRDWLASSERDRLPTEQILVIEAPHVIEEVRGVPWAEVAVANLIDVATAERCLILFGGAESGGDDVSGPSVVSRFGHEQIGGTGIHWAHTGQEKTRAAVEWWINSPVETG